MTAYYNEIDPLKAEVLREAIKAGAIAPGDVDERSISDVRGFDLAGYTQCHFFAGGGFWSLALRLAGWPDDRRVWTGSCPCPSFSAAGKGAGFADARHLWPDWVRLIRECRPANIFGEQVAAAIGHGWLDLVQTDLEAEAYAFGKVVFGAHSVGAPHIRQRLYFCSDTEHAQRRPEREIDGNAYGRIRSGRGSDTGSGSDASDSRRLAAGQHGGGRSLLSARPEQCGDIECGAIPMHPERRTVDEHGRDGCDGQDIGWAETHGIAGTHGEVLIRPHADGRHSSDGGVQRGGQLGLLAQDCGTGERIDTMCNGVGHIAREGLGAQTAIDREDGSLPGQRLRIGEPSTTCSGVLPIRARLEGHRWDEREWRGPGWLDPQQARSVAEAGATRGWWGDCDWWYGRDGKYRPIGPGLQPLAHGSKARVGRLRMYGDGIVVPQAQAFIEAYLQSRGAEFPTDH